MASSLIPQGSRVASKLALPSQGEGGLPSSLTCGALDVRPQVPRSEGGGSPPSWKGPATRPLPAPPTLTQTPTHARRTRPRACTLTHALGPCTLTTVSFTLTGTLVQPTHADTPHRTPHTRVQPACNPHTHTPLRHSLTRTEDLHTQVHTRPH